MIAKVHVPLDSKPEMSSDGFEFSEREVSPLGFNTDDVSEEEPFGLIVFGGIPCPVAPWSKELGDDDRIGDILLRSRGSEFFEEVLR